MPDFRSAYSVSPRDSYRENSSQQGEMDGLTPTSTRSMVDGLKVPITDIPRPRAYSNATTVGEPLMDAEGQ